MVQAGWFTIQTLIQFGSFLGCIGAILQASSTGIAMLVIGRFFAGLCIGMASVLVPIYQSEIAPRKIRGRVVALQHFALACGVLIQYLIQYGCSFLDSQAVFRLPWLASKDRWDEVLHILAFLRTPDCDINDPLVLAEYKEIEDQIRIEREEASSSYRELFVQGWSQLIGVNMLLYFVIYVLDSAGIANGRLATSIYYITVDCFSAGKSTSVCAEVIKRRGGKVVTLLPNGKSKVPNVTYDLVMAYTVFGHAFQWLPPIGPKFAARPEDREALVRFYDVLPQVMHILKPVPTIEQRVGFDCILEGLDKLRAGMVSGGKQVVRLDGE
ncbi:hypothetical protein V1508DRAFT_465207 [Lipomyces doorenjongii]|uniref:uncharacterized protein n=1 Tax=Lipomyces doorenjongii TaxID=383834 RepID=UPI0034CD2F39